MRRLRVTLAGDWLLTGCYLPLVPPVRALSPILQGWPHRPNVLPLHHTNEKVSDFNPPSAPKECRASVLRLDPVSAPKAAPAARGAQRSDAGRHSHATYSRSEISPSALVSRRASAAASVSGSGYLHGQGAAAVRTLVSAGNNARNWATKGAPVGLEVVVEGAKLVLGDAPVLVLVKVRKVVGRALHPLARGTRAR